MRSTRYLGVTMSINAVRFPSTPLPSADCERLDDYYRRLWACLESITNGIHQWPDVDQFGLLFAESDEEDLRRALAITRRDISMCVLLAVSHAEQIRRVIAQRRYEAGEPNDAD